MVHHARVQDDNWQLTSSCFFFQSMSSMSMHPFICRIHASKPTQPIYVLPRFHAWMHKSILAHINSTCIHALAEKLQDDLKHHLRGTTRFRDLACLIVSLVPWILHVRWTSSIFHRGTMVWGKVYSLWSGDRLQRIMCTPGWPLMWLWFWLIGSHTQRFTVLCFWDVQGTQEWPECPLGTWCLFFFASK